VSVSFDGNYTGLVHELLSSGERVETHWQAMRGVPQNQTIELTNVEFRCVMPVTGETASLQIAPTLPWAEDHFQERVSRVPHNPPPSAAYWQRGKGVDEHRDAQGKFSHTYPERFWPKQAHLGPNNVTRYNMQGIRYPYGDLDDVVSLLAREPYTRQAYLPVWFPEDTGAVHGERVPCTLGYHFLLREGRLHTFYPIRSCDLLRHFRNDVYMAVRLTQWVIDQLNTGAYAPWVGVTPGTLTMHIVSLHVFEADLPALEYQYA
jgi:hypothetical protein